MWPQLSFVREYKLGNDLYEGILDDTGQRRMLSRQAHSSVVALRLCLHLLKLCLFAPAWSKHAVILVTLTKR